MMNTDAGIPITPTMFPCPLCGADPVGTIDTIVCRWTTGDDGAVIDWDGNDLDTQSPLYHDGLPVLVCRAGDRYSDPYFTTEVMHALYIRKEPGR